VTNERGQRLRCSHWEPEEYPATADGGQLPCLVYLHGNSSARLEALPQLSLCLSLGITLAALDFSGSGLSEGEYVSLGFFEKDDLKALIADLRLTGRVSCVALWGRSMGAVTAIMHGERDPGIAALVLDSPFSDLSVLADDLVDKGREHGVHVPRFVTRLALRAIRASVQQRAGFNINALAAIQHAPQCFMPALFVAGKDDDFIAPSHARALHAVYGGDANVLVVEGDHNSMRPRFLYDSVSIFLQQTLPVHAGGVWFVFVLFCFVLCWPGPCVCCVREGCV
jgi:pimeloyl-ACP methyl ester carboxylesterase